MVSKLCWTGLALILAFPVLGFANVFAVAGAIILIIGVVLMWLDK